MTPYLYIKEQKKRFQISMKPNEKQTKMNSNLMMTKSNTYNNARRSPVNPCGIKLFVMRAMRVLSNDGTSKRNSILHNLSAMDNWIRRFTLFFFCEFSFIFHSRYSIILYWLSLHAIRTANRLMWMNAMRESKRVTKKKKQEKIIVKSNIHRHTFILNKQTTEKSSFISWKFVWKLQKKTTLNWRCVNAKPTKQTSENNIWIFIIVFFSLSSIYTPFLSHFFSVTKTLKYSIFFCSTFDDVMQKKEGRKRKKYSSHKNSNNNFSSNHT